MAAHSEGVSYEDTIDGYEVDIGYSSPAPTTRDVVIFDFNLPASEAESTYTDVWVRVVSEEGTVVFASALHNAQFGGPRLSYLFPKAGTYTISARYENGSHVLFEASFPLTVIEEEGEGKPFSFDLIHGIVLLVGLLLGMGIVRVAQIFLRKGA
jgi:hypothetical protein